MLSRLGSSGPPFNIKITAWCDAEDNQGWHNDPLKGKMKKMMMMRMMLVLMVVVVIVAVAVMIWYTELEIMDWWWFSCIYVWFLTHTLTRFSLVLTLGERGFLPVYHSPNPQRDRGSLSGVLRRKMTVQFIWHLFQEKGANVVLNQTLGGTTRSHIVQNNIAMMIGEM